MEHRWGERVGVDLPAQLTAHAFNVRQGRVTNLSVSGAFVKGEFDLRLLSRVQLTIELPFRAKHMAPTVAGYVARKSKDGYGIEWCEFAPPPVSELLQSLAARRHVHLRKPEPQATVAIARLSSPLLKHAT